MCSTNNFTAERHGVKTEKSVSFMSKAKRIREPKASKLNCILDYYLFIININYDAAKKDTF